MIEPYILIVSGRFNGMATDKEKMVLKARPRNAADAQCIINELEKAVKSRIKKGYVDKGNQVGPRFEKGALLVSSFENHSTKMSVVVVDSAFLAYREGRPAPTIASLLSKRPAAETTPGAARKKVFSEVEVLSGGSGSSDCQIFSPNSGPQ